MKPTDVFQNLGRPVAYYPGLRKITGSTTATILLCQFLYWRGKESDPNGWLFKDSFELEEETGLTYEEQKVARRYLRERGYLIEKQAKLRHKIGFKLNIKNINKDWEYSMLHPTSVRIRRSRKQ